LNGTNPLNPASVPVAPVFLITQISLAGGNVQIGCASVTNWTFQLQRCDALGTGWSNVNPAQTGTGGALLFSDAATNTTRFYRIQAR